MKHLYAMLFLVLAMCACSSNQSEQKETPPPAASVVAQPVPVGEQELPASIPSLELETSQKIQEIDSLLKDI